GGEVLQAARSLLQQWNGGKNFWVAAVRLVSSLGPFFLDQREQSFRRVRPDVLGVVPGEFVVVEHSVRVCDALERKHFDQFFGRKYFALFAVGLFRGISWTPAEQC